MVEGKKFFGRKACVNRKIAEIEIAWSENRLCAIFLLSVYCKVDINLRNRKKPGIPSSVGLCCRWKVQGSEGSGKTSVATNGVRTPKARQDVDAKGRKETDKPRHYAICLQKSSLITTGIEPWTSSSVLVTNNPLTLASISAALLRSLAVTLAKTFCGWV